MQGKLVKELNYLEIDKEDEPYYWIGYSKLYSVNRW